MFLLEFITLYHCNLTCILFQVSWQPIMIWKNIAEFRRQPRMEKPTQIDLHTIRPTIASLYGSH
ncbi:hypothetical protein KFK09_016617 [Dendrobium nobile]|uniref:Uncharacterized protein n=1 Tax=Dendrobium nobile TaxID=94219 RepID=A0A8T3B145_DENNO|nr:hypothetical protein KFK09_016617 [Dendrobium nobile]